MKYCIVLIFLVATTVRAQEYVLPYPGPMPGNTMYLFMNVIDTFQGWWSWGSIAQTRYHLGLADKYLVEAKTLFEYKQYLLAVESLQRSNEHISQVNPELVNAVGQGKAIQQYYDIVVLAAEKHKQVLEKLIVSLPATYNWTPEKAANTELLLQKEIQDAILLRQQVGSDLYAFYQCVQRISSTVTPVQTISEGCWQQKENYKNIIEYEELNNNEPYM